MPLTLLDPKDGFFNWYTKTNALITLINSLAASGSIVTSNSPVAGQILVYDGVTYKNVVVTGDISINSSGIVTFTGTSTGGGTKGRRYYYSQAGGLR